MGPRGRKDVDYYIFRFNRDHFSGAAAVAARKKGLFRAVAICLLSEFGATIDT
jgi:hypothetical protein